MLQGNSATRCEVARLRNIWCNDLRFPPAVIKTVDAQMEKLDPDWLKVTPKSNAGPKKPQEPPTHDVKNSKSANVKEANPAASKEGKLNNPYLLCLYNFFTTSSVFKVKKEILVGIQF